MSSKHRFNLDQRLKQRQGQSRLKQTELLRLWDILGVPHDKPKQLFGRTLTIIGFEVDPNAMTITMPLAARNDFVAALRDFG